MRYHNLDLWLVERPDGSYELQARCDSHGETTDESALVPGELETEQKVLSGGVVDQAFLTRLGTRLYAYVLATATGDMDVHFHRCLGAAESRPDEGVRLRLRIEAPATAALPWEYLYSRRRHCFLATSVQTPVVRYLELPLAIRELETTPPLQMLVLIPSGSGLDTATERRHLEEAIAGLQAEVQWTILDGLVTRTRVSDALLERRYHLVHYIGHGEFRDERAFLLLNDDAGNLEALDHERFGALFANHPTLKLVVLNACQGATVSSTRPLAGLAPELVKRGVPAVVAMQFPISDAEAISFAREFYRCLFRGLEKGRVEVAVSHARNILGAEFPSTVAVGAPVLFMRAPEGMLFHLVTGSLHRDLPLLPRALDTTRAAERTIQENVDLLKKGDPDLPEEERLQAIEREEAQLARIRQRLRFRNATIAVATAVPLVVFFLWWMTVFDFLPAQLKPEYYMVGVAGTLAEPPFSDELVIVAADEPLGIDRRADHARLVERLSTARASVVAFDKFFRQEADDDTAFAAAMNRARERGTVVLLGVRDRTPRGPEIVETLRGAAGGWGTLCMGHSRRSPNVVPLLVTARDSDGEERYPALALQAVAAHRGAEIIDLDRARRQVNLLRADGTAVGRQGIADVALVRQSQVCGAIQPGDGVAEMILAYSALATLRDPVRQHDYARVLAASDSAMLAAFAGRIVLVGDAGDLRIPVWRGGLRESRLGYELHADAINTILIERAIRWLGAPEQFLIILAMALAGAGLAYTGRPSRPAVRLALVAGALALYLSGAVVLFLTQHLLLNALYHVLALVVSFAAVRQVKQRLYP
jgi:CHASE2 domain-containing sensor protein